MRASRITAVVLGVFAIGLGILAAEQNIAFLVALAFAVAAAASLPTILYSLTGNGSTPAALWSMYGGLISTIVLVPAGQPRHRVDPRWRSSWASSAR